MFDVGFWEMVLVGVVALLVFGPERLPRVARETALWLRKLRSMVSSVKQDIDRELQLYELQEALRKEKKALTTFDRQESDVDEKASGDQPSESNYVEAENAPDKANGE